MLEGCKYIHTAQAPLSKSAIGRSDRRQGSDLSAGEESTGTSAISPDSNFCLDSKKVPNVSLRYKSYPTSTNSPDPELDCLTTLA